MAITNKDKEIYAEKVKHIRVIPLNMEVMNADIDKSIKEEIKKAGDSSFAPKIKENEYFHINGKLGIIKGTNILIDDECIGDCIEDLAVLEIYSKVLDEDGKQKNFSLFPRFTTKQRLEDLQKEFGKDEVSLKDFMDSRFAYNGRILANMNEILTEYKKQVK